MKACACILQSEIDLRFRRLRLRCTKLIEGSLSHRPHSLFFILLSIIYHTSLGDSACAGSVQRQQRCVNLVHSGSFRSASCYHYFSMRAAVTAVLLCIFNSSTLVLGQASTPLTLLGLDKGRNSRSASTMETVSIVPSSFASSPSPSTQQGVTTTTETIDISTYITTSSVSASATSATEVAADTPTVPFSSIPMSSSSSLSDVATSSNHRTLIIALSTVLGFVGLFLIASVIFLGCRYRRRQMPFGHRGASPINDEEIDSWRRSAEDQKRHIPPMQHIQARRGASTIPAAPSPGWNWATSPTSIRTVPVAIPDTPSFVAKAPNSRAGLTDETVPGADPFIPPVKRQSSRLSKAPPGHSRTKSRRSSMSAKSIWSLKGQDRESTDSKAKSRHPTWYDPDDETDGAQLREFGNGSSTPGTSIFGELPTGGLSPRPKSRPRLWELDIDVNDIGRAIA